MARKKSDLADKTKLDLGQTLLALDTKNMDYYKNLTDEEKKKYAPVVLMRFMSSAPNQGNLHEYFLSSTNAVLNEDFWSLSKHPELQHKLLCVCGLGKKNYHQWIPMVKKTNTNKLFQFFLKTHPGINNTEFEILVAKSTEEDIEDLGKEYALEDKEIEDLVKQFNTVKNDASNA